METTIALINQQTDFVENIIVVGDTWQCPEGFYTASSIGANIGWLYDQNSQTYSDPTPPAPPPPPVFPILTSGEFQQGLVNMGILTYSGILAAAKQAELPYPLKQIVDAAVVGGSPTASQLQASPYNLPAPVATGVAQAIAGGLTLTEAERDKITFTWVTMVQVGRDYPIIGQLQLVLGIPDADMDQLFLTRGTFNNG